MSRRGRLATGYGLAFVGFSVGAGLLYPFFGDESFVGLETPPPTVLVFQAGSLGETSTTAQVAVDSVDEQAHLLVTQSDLADSSDSGAAVVVAVERWTGEGYAYDLVAPDCRATADDTEVTTETVGSSAVSRLYAVGTDEGVFGGVPDLSGEATSIVLDDPAVDVEIDCALPPFRFTRESLANRNIYVPGIEAYGVEGGQRPVRSYSLAREGSDSIVQVSQPPSETLTSDYVWYERDFENLARQGIFLTVTNPSLQQESSMRLFGAGGLLGLAGGFLVAAVQQLLEPRRPEPS